MCAVALACALWAVPSMAAPLFSPQRLVVTPAITARTACDDNLFLENKSDCYAVAEPEVKVEMESDTTRVRLRGDVRAYAYGEHDVYNRTDYGVEAKVDHTVSPDASATFTFYFQDEQSFQSELEETGTVVDPVSRKSLGARAGVGVRLSERTRAEVAVEGMTALYDDRDDLNYSEAGLVLRLWHKLDNRRTDLTGKIFGAAQEYEAGHQQFSGVAVGLEHEFTPRLSGSLLVGGWAEWTDFEADSGTRAGPGFEGALTWELERGRIRATAQRWPMRSGGSENVLVDRLRVSADWDITERWRAGCALQVAHGETGGYEGEGGKDESLSFTAAPRLTYRLTEHMDVALQYEYTHQQDLDAHTDETRNKVMLWFRSEFPEEW